MRVILDAFHKKGTEHENYKTIDPFALAVRIRRRVIFLKINIKPSSKTKKGQD
jgi:hypothetical protein